MRTFETIPELYAKLTFEELGVLFRDSMSKHDLSTTKSVLVTNLYHWSPEPIIQFDSEFLSLSDRSHSSVDIHQFEEYASVGYSKVYYLHEVSVKLINPFMLELNCSMADAGLELMRFLSNLGILSSMKVDVIFVTNKQDKNYRQVLLPDPKTTVISSSCIGRYIAVGKKEKVVQPMFEHIPAIEAMAMTPMRVIIDF